MNGSIDRLVGTCEGIRVDMKGQSVKIALIAAVSSAFLTGVVAVFAAIAVQHLK